MKFVIFLVVIGISFTANADFLIVQRNANLRQNPSTDSEILEKLRRGDTLILVEDNLTSNYYHVISQSSLQEGWVFHNLVRKVSGDIEVAESLTPNAVVDIRILDVGQGQCNLIKLPGNKYVIYDAGGEARENGNKTFNQIKDYIPIGSEIELLVLSHTDADHIVAAEQVVKNYMVKKVLWTGFERSMVSSDQPTGAYDRLFTALENNSSIENVNLNQLDSVITPGNEFTVSNAIFTFLCGFGKPLEEWGLTDRAEKLNSVSIVMKLTFGGKSVLFCGDAVGRHREDPESSLIATEHYLLSNATLLLPSTIVIAPHHGAKNGSSQAFVDAVHPEYVIFSSGRGHHHPTTRTANQYLRNITNCKILRTDLGDDEGTGEWNFGRIPGNRDPYNDDNIQIQLRSNGTYRVYYLTHNGSCN